MMTLWTALSLLLLSLLLDAVTGTLFGATLSLPLGVLFYFSTVRHLPWTLSGAIAAGFILDVLCGRTEPFLLKCWPIALLAGAVIRSRLGDVGRWTALPAGAVMQLVSLSGRWSSVGTVAGLASLFFETVGGAVVDFTLVCLIDLLAQKLRVERYATVSVRRVNQPPRKHRSEKISTREVRG